MKGILLVAHGSRVPETCDLMETILEKVKEKANQIPIALSYMEFSEQTIEKGLLSLIQQGVTSVKVIPHFLFSGIHLQKDIPEEITHALEGHPHVSIEYCPPYGADSRLIEMIVERIES